MLDKRRFYPYSMASSFTVRCFLYPLTLVRTRLQVQQSFREYIIKKCVFFLLTLFAFDIFPKNTIKDCYNGILYWRANWTFKVVSCLYSENHELNQQNVIFQGFNSRESYYCYIMLWLTMKGMKKLKLEAPELLNFLERLRLLFSSGSGSKGPKKCGSLRLRLPYPNWKSSLQSQLEINICS